MTSVTTMPWGKYRGVRLAAIEPSYLLWVLEKATGVTPDLAIAIKAELGRRFSSRQAPPRPPTWRKPCPDPSLASTIVAAGLRTLAKKTHPDVGGDTSEMQRLNATADWLRTQVPQ